MLGRLATMLGDPTISEFPIDDATTTGTVARPGTSRAAPSCFQGQIVGCD